MGSPSRDLYETAALAAAKARIDLGPMICERCGGISVQLKRATIMFDGALYADPGWYCPPCLATMAASGLTVTVMEGSDVAAAG